MQNEYLPQELKDRFESLSFWICLLNVEIFDADGASIQKGNPHTLWSNDKYSKRWAMAYERAIDQGRVIKLPAQ